MVRGLRMIAPALLAGFIGLLAPLAVAQAQEKENANVWAKAEAKMEAHLKGIDPTMRYAEFTSERLSKYLPGYRVFVGYERNISGETALFLVNQNAEITDLAVNDLAGISAFLRARSISVKTPEDASDFVQFFREFQGSKSYVALLHINTKGFTLINKEFIETYYGKNEKWKFKSAKREDGWRVTLHWNGYWRASIVMPPSYEIDIDKEGHFRALKEGPEFFR